MTNHRSDPPTASISFDVDGTLGRLAKWLRILGFDAAFPRSAPSAGRLFVTARRSVMHGEAIIVTSEDLHEQLRQVLEQAGVCPDPDLFLTRCLICNVPVREATREKAAGRVPQRILEKVALYHECPLCGRIYWEGSHADRIKTRLQSVLEV
jgi:uncharacterized protein